MDLLLDAELDTDDSGNRHSIACLRDSHDPTLWHHSITMIHALLGLANVRRSIEGILTGNPPDFIQQSSDFRNSQASSGLAADPEHVAEIMHVVREVSSSLRSLGSSLADSVGTTAEHEGNLLALAEAVSVFRGKLPWVTTLDPA